SMFGMRYAPPFYTAHRLVEEGRIGRPRLISARKSYKLGQRPEWVHSRARSGGMIPWVASHGIDLLHWFAGCAPIEVTAAHSRVGNRGHGEWEVSASCQFRFPGDLAGVVQADCLRAEDAASHGDDRLRVVGTEGILEVRHGKLYLNDQEHEPHRGPSLLRDIVAICRGNKPGILSTPQTFQVTESALRAREAADTRRTVQIGGLSDEATPSVPRGKTKPPRVLLVGLEGFGRSHAQTALELSRQNLCRIVGGVDPAHSELADDHPLKSENPRVFADLQQALEDTEPELVVICTPIHTHRPLAQAALQAGCSVLLEKPGCGSLEEAADLIALAEAAPGFLALGYQMCYNPGNRRLKEDIRRGRFGKPRDFSVSVLWPRPVSYYQRNTWAGRVLTDDGRPVLDSPHNNACAHFLFQLLWLLGETEAGAASVTDLRAALGRAHAIENCDTTLLEMRTPGGATLRFAASHAVADTLNPRFRLEFEDATILSGSGGGLCAHTSGGVVTYPGGSDQRLKTCLQALSGDAAIPCDARASARHTEVVVAAQTAGVAAAPEELVQRREDGHVIVAGLAEQIASVCDLQRLPRIPWLPLSPAIDVNTLHSKNS
ncbi:MAG: Gfo/Idh/MocA family protein, partial [Verrucomicrobiota bacterium]